MIDKDSIDTILASHGTAPLRAAIAEAMANDGLVGVPSFMRVTDLEGYMPNRRRLSGRFYTDSALHFAEYVDKHKEEGAAVFINTDNMKATGVLNLGTPEAPGHGDNLALLSKRISPEYSALLQIASGTAKSQRDVAEFIEDWQLNITCADDTDEIPNKQAIAAVRSITIEALKRQEATEEKLSASKSAFESVQATSKEKIPTLIEFKCNPYNDLPEQVFRVRVGILTTDKPQLVLRIAMLDKHKQQMGEDFKSEIETVMGENSVPVYLGEYGHLDQMYRR